MKKEGTARRFSLLAVSVVIAKIIGALYRIPLTNILGAEGIGIYQLIFPVFSLLLTLCSGGIPSAISLAVASRRARGESTESLLYCSMLAIGVFGALLTVVLVAVSKPLSLLQANERASVCYLAIAPTIFLAGLISVLRGYYMGYKNMLPTAISQVNEAGVKLGVGLALAKLLFRFGLEYAVAGALLGVTVSELLTLIPFAFYARNEKGLRPTLAETKSTLKELFAVAVPLTASGVILPLSQFGDSLLIVNLLRFGTDAQSATRLYGLLTGTVAPLINLPVMVSLSLGLAVMPSLAECRQEHKLEAIKNKTAACIKLALFVCVPFALVFVFMGDSVVRLLYPRLTTEQIAVAGYLLQLQAVNVVSLSVGQIATSVLQALGESRRAVRYLALSVGVKTLLILILIPLIGIRGGAVSSIVCFALNTTLCLITLVRFIGRDKRMAKNSSLIALAGVIMSTLIFAFKYFVGGRFAVVITAVAAGVCYALSLFVLGVFEKKELECLPFSRLWLKLDKILRRGKDVTA